MAQAGIHSMVGMAVRKWTPARKWLMLGIVLGNLFPDADNLAVAVATVMGKPTEGLQLYHCQGNKEIRMGQPRPRLGYWGVNACLVGLVDLVQWCRNSLAAKFLG